MGALCAAIAIIAVVLPHAGGLGLLGTVPMGLLSYRYRIRVLITATVAAGVIGFLVVGLSGFMTVLLCAYVGGLAGIVKRRGRGTPTVIAVTFVAGVVVGAVVVMALTVLGPASGAGFRRDRRDRERSRGDHGAGAAPCRRRRRNSRGCSPKR